MEKEQLENEIREIHQKLDIITRQMHEQQVRQQEWQELRSDMTLIGKDIFDAAVTELEDVAPYFDTADLAHLLKKLLRNTRNLSKMLTQMESVNDLFEDLKPLGKQVFDEWLENFNEFDRKGYFDFFGEAIKIVDTVVTSFSVEDVRLLRENITSILLTIKGITQPDMLNTVDNALGFFSKMDITVEKDISYMEIFREMRNPEVRRGIVFMLEFVKNMAKNDRSSQTAEQQNQ